SKDKRREEPAREADYLAGLARAPWQVKVCKLADLFDNLLDSDNLSAEQTRRAVRKAHDALAVLRDARFPEPERAAGQPVHQRALALVADLLTRVEARS